VSILPFFFFALGAILASFAGVIAERLHTGQSIMNGRSRCNSCDRALGMLELVPILSWLFALGQCRKCQARVPVLYVALELALGALFLLSYYHVGLAPALLPLLLFFFTLSIIVLYDLRHMVVPPMLSAPLLAFALLYAVLAYPFPHALGGAFLTAGLIALAFYLLHVASRGRLMGLGDTPVVLALSLVAGSLALAGLLYAVWIGGIVGIIILLKLPKHTRMGIEVPFVPFLAAGYTLAYFTQWNILSYLGY
jgi:prepilin signal peptidase PulO-like enzyme (type II secretory pathway)